MKLRVVIDIVPESSVGVMRAGITVGTAGAIHAPLIKAKASNLMAWPRSPMKNTRCASKTPS